MAVRALARAAAIGAGTCLMLATTLLGATPALAQTVPPSSPPAAGSAGSPQQATPTERAAAAVRPAVAYLTGTFSGYVADETGTFFNDGNPFEFTSTCTGFGVNPNGYVATAGHCVDTTSPDGIRAEFIKLAAQQVVSVIPDLDINAVYAFGLANWSVEGAAKGSPVDSQISVITGATTGTGTTGQALPARVVDFRPFEQGDVALLKIEATDLPSVELAADADVQIGTPVLSVGYPASADAVTDPSLEPSNKDGQVSSKKTVGSVPVYETSAALTQGMSGGPSIALDGRVLGVNSFMPAGESQAFNFIAPSTGLSELLSRNGVRNELGPDDQAYRAALNAYYAGRYTDAIAGFDRLIDVAPQHAQAQQFRTMAAKARDKFGDAPAPADDSSGLSPVLLWSLVGGGAAVLVGGGVIGIVVANKRRRRLAQASIPAQRDGLAAAGFSGWEQGSGPAQYGTVGAQPYGAPQNAAQQYGIPQNGSNPYGSPQNGAARFGAAQNGAARFGAAQNGAAPHGTPENGMGQYGALQNGAAHSGVPQNGAPQYGTARFGSAQPDPQYGAASYGSANGAATNGSAWPAPHAAQPPADVTGQPTDSASAVTAVVSLPDPAPCTRCGTAMSPGAAACTTCGQPRH